MQGRTDRGALVQTGEGISHKLSGAISGNTSRQDIPERTGKQTAVAYINNLGRTASAQVTTLARQV